MRLSAAKFADLVVEALADIPEGLRAYMSDVSVDVEPTPDRSTCKAAGVGDPRSLLGLYCGTPVTERSVEHSMQLPDRIVIYRRNIQRLCRTRAEAVKQIRKTVFHEVGHHFGLNEDDLAKLGYD